MAGLINPDELSASINSTNPTAKQVQQNRKQQPQKKVVQKPKDKPKSFLGKVTSTVGDIVDKGLDVAKSLPGGVSRIAKDPKSAGTAIGLAGIRSGLGTAQGASGLVDLATPGKGTNRVSKKLDSAAKFTDATAKAEGVNNGLYKGSQGATDLLQLAVGGGEAKAVTKAATKAPKVGGIIKSLTKANGTLEKKVADKTAGLAKKGLPGKVGAKTAQNIVKPGYQGANAAFTALQAGKDASTGKALHPKDIAENLAIGGVGFPVAGAIAKEGEAAAVPVIKKGVEAISKKLPEPKAALGKDKATSTLIDKTKSNIALDEARVANAPKPIAVADESTAADSVLVKNKKDQMRLPATTGKAEGDGFTMAPVADEQKANISKQLGKVNKQLDAHAQGTKPLDADKVKALIRQRDDLNKAGKGEVPAEDVIPTNTRAAQYKAHDTNPVTMDKAAKKLVDAGYDTAEAKTILLDANPEKSTKLPGIGRSHDYSDASVQRAAHQYDKKNPSPLGQAVDKTIPPPEKKNVVGLSGSGRKAPEPNTERTTPKVAGSAIKDEAKAVKAGLEKRFEGKANYNSGSYKTEADKAIELVNTDKRRAVKIAMRKEPGDSRIHEVAVYEAVKNKAIKDGDIDLIDQLKNSPAHTEFSEAGQTLGARGYAADPHDPIEIIRDVEAAKAKGAEKRLKGTKPVATAEKADREAIKVATPKVDKYDWNNFIDGLRC